MDNIRETVLDYRLTFSWLGESIPRAATLRGPEVFTVSLNIRPLCPLFVGHADSRRDCF
jgi:hypothetical protein